MDLAIENFAADLHAEVQEAIDSAGGTEDRAEEFTRIVLERLGDEGALENPQLLWQEGTFGRTRYKLSGFSFPEEEDRLLLTGTIFTGEQPPRVIGRDEIMQVLMHLLKFYENSSTGLVDKITPKDSEASDLANRIHECHDKIGVLRLVLISDGQTGHRSIDLKEAFDGTRVIVDMLGIEQLYRILGRGLARDDIVLDFESQSGGPLPCLKVSADGADYDAFLAALPGEALADVYEKYGNRLLELNVRSFLGVRGRKSVNANLRKTIQDEPSRFMAYNNGIVATADDIQLEFAQDGSIRIRSLHGLQIVNGGQTTASLHRAKKQDKASLSNIWVPAKIIKVSGTNLDDMVMAISRSANSQNTIQPADFSANDPFHVFVETLANNTWLSDGKSRWFYERARGSYGAAEIRASFTSADKKRFASETPKVRRFSKTDLAKVLNAWDGFPHQVSLGNQKNFQFFMQRLKEENPNGFRPDSEWFKMFVAKTIVFRAVQSIVKSQNFPAYKANITTYTFSRVANASAGAQLTALVWNNQNVSDQLQAVIAKWSHEIDEGLRRTAAGRMPSEWAKKSECWAALSELQLPSPDVVPPEWESPKSNVRDGKDKRADQAEPTSLDLTDAMLKIRQLFSGSEVRDPGDLADNLAQALGHGAVTEHLAYQLSEAITVALRRGILERREEGVAILARSIDDYERHFLKDQFVASQENGSWIDREDGIRRMARWLGFKRTGPSIELIAKSVINGLIREGRIESKGTQIRRT
jgi:hypothetical protein